MRKSIITAALFAAWFSAKAQTVQVFNSCDEATRVFTFARLNTRSNPVQWYTIGSQCPSAEFPPFKVAEGFYQFDNLPIATNEIWTYVIDKDGELIGKGIAKDRLILAQLGERERLTIFIAPKWQCDCPKAVKQR